jgi:hypothetical protein
VQITLVMLCGHRRSALRNQRHIGGYRAPSVGPATTVGNGNSRKPDIDDRRDVKVSVTWMAVGWARQQPDAEGDGTRGEWWSYTATAIRVRPVRTDSVRVTPVQATATVRAVTRMSAMSTRQRCYPLAMASLVLDAAGRRRRIYGRR